MIKTGFIGTGWTDLGQIHAFKKAGLVPQAIFSRDYKKAELIASKHDIPEIYSDWKKLVDSDSVDLVSIVVPTWLHSEILAYSKMAGKHFICEAPFLSMDEINSLLNLKND
ncbi:Gfo/Idh/MocA family protein, partial [Xanthovirga aplysinae]|uniref:Gfo/Idh/MocA family protein n=1 Tax=Xanthovirga aplysinae TaxID=2529853 RepID=UPI00165727B5